MAVHQPSTFNTLANVCVLVCGLLTVLVMAFNSQPFAPSCDGTECAKASEPLGIWPTIWRYVVYPVQSYIVYPIWGYTEDVVIRIMFKAGLMDMVFNITEWIYQ